MRKHSQGLSLIELMIALLIGTLLILGVMQVFGASRVAYQLSQGMARTQENARFAMDYLQRDARMAGHFGCVNDQARKLGTNLLMTHISTGDAPLNFNLSIRGYEATGTGPSSTAVNLAGLTSGWSPGLPGYISGLTPAPNAGSDILVLRFLDSHGVPVTNVTADNITVASTKWNVLTQDGVSEPMIFGVSDCTNADVFQASSVAPNTGVIGASATGGLTTSKPDFLGRYTAQPSGQTTLYRAESLVYYIGTRQGAAVPSLYRARFGYKAGTGQTVVSEELVEGIQNLQLLYGLDQSNDVNQLTGNITSYSTADTLGATETAWRRVGQVKLGLIAISPEGAAAQQSVGLTVAGLTFTPPADAAYRSAYETSVALRNRLYGN